MGNPLSEVVRAELVPQVHVHEAARMTSQNRAVFAICVLFAINTMNFLDRQIPGAVGELIKIEWNLSDKELGFVGTAFILVYAAIGVPLGRLADRGNRSWILAVGVFIWSLLTFGSGLARNFWQMVAFRLGVGVGEATCAPASNSLIGDLVPSSGRARALSFFMLGLPIGIALSYWISTAIAHNPNWGWRYAFFVALVPGLLCAIGALFIREPKRGGSEAHDIGRTSAPGRRTCWSCRSRPCGGSSPRARCTTSTCTRWVRFWCRF